jgi:hypothetical protein
MSDRFRFIMWGILAMLFGSFLVYFIEALIH